MPPTLRVRIGFANSPLATPTWIDVTGYVRTSDPVTIQRGKSNELDTAQAGTLSLTLEDPDRDFDPGNTASPYWPFVRPMQRIEVSGVWNTTVEERFVGFINSWQPRITTDDHRVVQINAVDALAAYFGLVKLDNDAKTFSFSGTGQTYLGGTASTYLGSGLPFFEINRVGGVVSGGTFTLSFRGYSVTLPWNATGADIKAALEAIPIIGFDTIPMFSSSLVSTVGGTMQVNFAGAYTGTNVSDMTISSNLTPVGRSYTLTYYQNAGGAPANYWPNPLGRRVYFVLSGAVAGSFYPIQITGLLTPGGAIYQESADIASGATTSNTSVAFYKILQIRAGPSVAGDVSKTLTVRFNPSTTVSLSSEQFDDILSDAAWPVAERDIQAGRATLAIATQVGATALESLTKVAESENGDMYVARNGDVTFRSRASRIVAQPIATLSNRAPDMPYKDITFSYSDRYLYNDVRVTREGGTEQIAQDSASAGQYLTRTLSKGGLLFTSDAESLTFAQFLRRIYKDPQTRIESVDLDGEADPDTLWPLLLASELCQRYTVMYYVPDTLDVITEDVHIESINETIQNGEWRITWALSPAISGFWVLGRSRLGRDTRLGF